MMLSGPNCQRTLIRPKGWIGPKKIPPGRNVATRPITHNAKHQAEESNVHSSVDTSLEYGLHTDSFLFSLDSCRSLTRERACRNTQVEHAGSSSAWRDSVWRVFLVIDWRHVNSQ